MRKIIKVNFIIKPKEALLNILEVETNFKILLKSEAAETDIEAVKMLVTENFKTDENMEVSKINFEIL